MDIPIPAWLATVLLVARFLVYLTALYLFVRAVARVEISRARPVEPTAPVAKTE